MDGLGGMDVSELFTGVMIVVVDAVVALVGGG